METGVLPKYSDLSSDQTKFLDQHFGASDDLLSDGPSRLLSELHTHCSDLDTDLLRLRRWLSKSTVSWISRSFATKSELYSVAINLQNLSLLTSQHQKRSRGLELPKLAEEVLRIERIRCYVETTLRLEALVGDLEDAVSCFMNRQTGNMFSAKPWNSLMHRDSGTKHEKLLQAIKSMNDIEDALGNLVGTQQTHWHRLLKSVDSRVDQNLGILRLQVSADHRALLNSLGWPPKLSASNIKNGLVSDVPTPLTIMQGEKKKSYSNSFIALCALQHFQTQRETRRLNISGRNTSNARLWAIDELVTPIGSRMEYHFSKWTDQPELIFALARRIAKNFIAGIDDVLQPLIDRARLASCSAGEAWVSAIVQTLSKFLEENFFSPLANKYKDRETRHEVIPSWLHLVDLIIPFDKQMQSLVSLEGLSGGSSLLNMFCDRPEWLKIWAKIELKNACKKLKIDMQDEECWRFDNKSQSESESERDRYIFSTREDHKAPPISESAVSIAREMIDRSQTMPCVLPRARFIRSTAGKFIWYVLRLLLFRYKGIELSPENFTDGSSQACSLINAARYIEFRLKDDDVDFIEMKIAENKFEKQEDEKAKDGCFFGDEIASLSELETNWLMSIVVFVLRRFETLSWDYVKQARHLEEVSAAVDLPVSVYFIESLDELKNQLRALKKDLNAKDFSDLWRGVADGLDHFVSFSGIFSKIRDRVDGINQFENDMKALFSVFKPFCVRPEAFFPNIQQGLEPLIVSRKRRGVKEYASPSLPREKDQ